jgi:undecaprenyl-diphosphatase
MPTSAPPDSAPPSSPHSLADAVALLRQWKGAALLFAVLALVVGAWAFVEIADVVTEGESHAWDERILFLFRTAGDLDDPIGPVAVEEAVRDLTALGGVLITSLASLIGVAYFLLDRRPRAALFLGTSILSGIGLTFLLKMGFDRPRPDLVAHQMEALSASFPSGHSATAAVVYLTLGALIARALPRRRLRVLTIGTAVVLTLGIGVSRVYLGVHWPTDVLAGWVIGAGWALAAWFVQRYLRRHGWIEPTQAVALNPEPGDTPAPDSEASVDERAKE